MNTRIYVATHRPENKLLTLSYPYIPIHVGKAVYNPDMYSEGYLPELGDDTGDNISSKNMYYSELTGMYWIWKNDNSEPDDLVGLNHYRRYFRSSVSSVEEPLTEGEMISTLVDRRYHFIINGLSTDKADPTRRVLDAVYYGYAQIHDIQYLNYALVAIYNLFPDIAYKIDYEIRHSALACYCNMFVTTKKYFDEYASFLFPILSYVESKLDPNSDKSHRVPGYVAERLMRPWIVATGHSAEQCQELFWDI